MQLISQSLKDHCRRVLHTIIHECRVNGCGILRSLICKGFLFFKHPRLAAAGPLPSRQAATSPNQNHRRWENDKPSLHVHGNISLPNDGMNIQHRSRNPSVTCVCTGDSCKPLASHASIRPLQDAKSPSSAAMRRIDPRRPRVPSLQPHLAWACVQAAGDISPSAPGIFSQNSGTHGYSAGGEGRGRGRLRRLGDGFPSPAWLRKNKNTPLSVLLVMVSRWVLEEEKIHMVAELECHRLHPPSSATVGLEDASLITPFSTSNSRSR